MNVNKKIVDNKFEIETRISPEMRDSVSAHQILSSTYLKTLTLFINKNIN
jgi:hypothetical protein